MTLESVDDHSGVFQIWVSSGEYGDDSHETTGVWGGRDCTYDECADEAITLLQEFRDWRFDPWCTGKPLDPIKEWLAVECIPTTRALERFSYGFDTRLTRWNFGPLYNGHCLNKHLVGVRDDEEEKE